MIEERGVLGEGGIDYGRAWRYQLDDESWIVTLLWMTLAMIVPVVGGVVALGYQGAVIEGLAREGVGARAPRFELERLVDYLLRGLRMFVVSLLVSLILLPLIWIGSVVMLAVVLGVTHAMGPQETASIMVGCALMAFFGVLAVALGVAASVVMTPPIVRAALDRDFGGIFDMVWARDFLRRTGREGWKVHLFVIAINIGLFVVGLLALFIGVFPALAFGLLVQAHLYGQLYLLYLRRGGAPVPLATGNAVATN
jgi:hypothetical protein